jgi:hypothetical protein
MPIHVECDPDAVTLKSMRLALSLAEIKTSDNLAVLSQVGVIAEMVSRWISAWDLREEDGETVVSLSVERLEEMGIGILQEIMMALAGAMRMGEATGMQSKPRSLPTRTQAKRGSSRR